MTPPSSPPPADDMADFDLDLLNQPSSSQDSFPPIIHSSPRALSTRALVETAFLASTTALIWLVQFYLQLGPVLRIFFAIPVALAYLRWNRRTSWMAAIVATLLLSVLLGPPRGVQFLIPHGLLGVLLGGFWKRQAPWWVSISLGTLLTGLGTLFQIGLLSLLTGDNLWLYANQQVTGLLNWLMSWFGWMGEANIVAVQMGLLGLTFLSASLYNFTVHLAAWLLFERVGNPIPDPPEWVQVLLEYQE
jgi:uncharacterized protein YybS (DUF2232 family)